MKPSNFTKPCSPNQNLDFFAHQWPSYIGVILLLLCFAPGESSSFTNINWFIEQFPHLLCHKLLEEINEKTKMKIKRSRVLEEERVKSGTLIASPEVLISFSFFICLIFIYLQLKKLREQRSFEEWWLEFKNLLFTSLVKVDSILGRSFYTKWRFLRSCWLPTVESIWFCSENLHFPFTW